MSDKADKAVEQLGDSFEEMFETAEAVKGEAFAQFVGFLVNSQALVRVIAMVCEDSIEEGRYVLADDEHPMRKVITRILNQGVSMYGDALGLSEEVMEEAAKFASVMQEKINQAEDLLDGEDE